MSLIERFANPELLKQMTLNEKLMASLIVTILGMLITFVVLMILWGVIVLMTKALNKEEKQKTSQAIETKVESKAKDIKEESINVLDDENEELVAIITAAVAASLKKSTHNIIVRNIVRVGDRSPAWAKLAKQEQLDSRRF